MTKIYDGIPAVDRMTLRIDDGEFMVLVGPSGCGKTTALRMVAGLEDVSSGTLRIGDRVVNHVPSRERDIAMVFQSYALYPHLTVFDNIAFGLRLQKVGKAEIDRRVREAASVLGLEPFLDRKPRALSGGQRQRVAMGRAIVREPQVFLLDEPLSNLDAKLRVQMRAEIGRLQQELGVTAIYVTHDQVEAMTMGNRIAVMRKGRLQQVGPPQELYDHPVNLFVAGFIGSPAMNMLETTVERQDGRLELTLGDRRIPLGEETLSRHRDLERYEGRPLVLGIRPEDIQDAAFAAEIPEVYRLPGRVELTEALGAEVIVHLRVNAKPATNEDVEELARDVGVEMERGETEATIVGRFDPRTRVRAGDATEVAINTRSLHFFDLETGAALYDGAGERR